MFNWIKKIYEKDKEVWHYTCENGHSWKSYESPKGEFLFEEKCTRCPNCKTIICRGEVWINEKKKENVNKASGDLD